MQRILFLLLAFFFLSGKASAIQSPLADLEKSDFFERKIRPLLSRHCYSCHSKDARPLHASLRLDSAAGLKQGGDSGELIDADSPGNSLLLKVLQYDGDIQMPPRGRLSERDLALLSAWIRSGAEFPSHSGSAPKNRSKIDFESGRQHWSFQPLSEPERPRVKLQAWPRNRIDFFVLKEIEKRGLSPSQPARPEALVRRLFFDLTGLPPSVEQLNRFVNNPSDAAFTRLVDQLLASPRYGEKWGRLWLDLARYTDKTASWLYSSDHAHRYRDWVVEAFNSDMPYNEFVHRQLATDLMLETGPADLPALGFISLSPTYWKELKLPAEIIRTIVADEWEERVDAVSRTFLGLTVACARCHDHKFDPISSADFYALAGVFASSRQVEIPMIAEELYQPVRLAKKKVADLEKRLAGLEKKKPAAPELIRATGEEIAALKKTPHYQAPLASALTEESLHVMRKGKKADQGTVLDYRSTPRDLPLFIRGNPNRPGPSVPRRFLTVLAEKSPPTPFRQGSGRLELARAITGDAAALAARVIVNRVWLAHFGQGLVDTPSNFGQQGSRPSHPFLLDDLAARFIRKGWSIKQLHREIVLSATWRQTSSPHPKSRERDVDNRWYSRMNRRRLDFEEWRDAMLQAGGRLDLEVGGPAGELETENNFRRTLYATVHRRDISVTMRTHDFPDPTQHSPRRSSTVTPLQGLYALNGPLLTRQAELLVERLNRHSGEDSTRIHFAHEILFGRSPSAEEIKLALRFLYSANQSVTRAGNKGGGRSAPGPDTSKRVPLERWIQYAHVLLAGNELMWID
ncbi:MAG: PSD1 and planctomycete cytochrome C domain-containing protein [Planctomycetota bacterium]|nr:PSD1 and planctomycete cytochrome C domain-containing protein [Planctomycetota bacterium]